MQELRPETSITIKDYVDTVFGPHILRYFNNHQRVDVVFDTYSSESIKSGTREKRGEGKRRRVNSETKVPGNWQDFLRVSQNKEELFKVISERLLEQLNSQSAGRDYFSEKVALFCINLEASRGVKIWRRITTFILHFNWF